MAEPKEPREPRIPKETAPFDADNKWTRTWIMYFESLFTLSVKEAVRQAGTVTHKSGKLTEDLPVFGNGEADIKVGDKTGDTNTLVTNTGTNVPGNTVEWDADGNLIDAGVTPGGGGGGTGTVTSVALTVPAEFSVSGSPVTTSGTLAVSKATQSANAVYAGPTTGSAAAPTFRAVVPADLPLASSSAFGAVKVDGTTITAASGVISAAGGGGGGGLVLLEQHTASSSASLDFTACITSTYDTYVVELVNLVPATNNVDFLLQFSTNGGSSYDSTSGHYSWASLRWIVSAVAQAGAATTTAICVSSGAGVVSNVASLGGLSGSFKIYNPLSGSMNVKVTGQLNHYYQSGFPDMGAVNGGTYLQTTAVNAFKIFSNSGNITSGTVRVYGIAK